ncbi:MAG: NUDIX domain-containing protein [Nanoarchaeota archaeon]
MRLPVQVLAIVYRVIDGRIEYLLLHRLSWRGAFWQPIGGGLEEGETLLECLARECREEMGTDAFISVIPDVNLVQYDQEEFLPGRTLRLTMYTYGVQVPVDAAITIENNPSPEHDDWKWCDYDTAMSLLKWEDNKVALKKLHTMLIEQVQRHP